MIRMGGFVALLSALWCLAGGIFLVVNGMPDSESPAWHAVLASGLAAGSIGLVIGGVVAGIGDHREKQRRWRADLHEGTATMTNLRPGDVNGGQGTQDLLCRLEITAVGMPRITGEYKAAVGPLDALKIEEDAGFRCEANPSQPERVRVQITPGRHLEFRRTPTDT